MIVELRFLPCTNSFRSIRIDNVLLWDMIGMSPSLILCEALSITQFTTKTTKTTLLLTHDIEIISTINYSFCVYNLKCIYLHFCKIKPVGLLSKSFLSYIFLLSLLYFNLRLWQGYVAQILIKCKYQLKLNWHLKLLEMYMKVIYTLIDV